jgi:hypothetical protein
MAHDENEKLLAAIEAEGKPVVSSQYLSPEGSSVFRTGFNRVVEPWNRVLVEPGETEVAAIAKESLHPQFASVLCRPTYTQPWALWVVGELRYGFTVVSTEQEAKRLDGEVMLPAPPARPGDVEAELEAILARVSARRYVRSISAEVGAAVCEVWKKVLAQTRYSDDQFRGNDDETYFFTYGGMAGTTWTPSGETIPRKLIRLCEALRDYVRSAETPESGTAAEADRHIACIRSRIEDLRVALHATS